MKDKLIDLWFVSDPTYRRRIENVLFHRYGYDIALRFPFSLTV